MNDPCKPCPIRNGCDWLSELCLLSGRQLIVLRPDLIKTDERRDNGKLRAAIAQLGFKKYDKRYRPGSKHSIEQRLLWRVYKSGNKSLRTTEIVIEL